MEKMEPIKVLFVCMGNICRSPTAHGVFQSLVDEQGLGESIQVDSAGSPDESDDILSATPETSIQH
jgi:protein-tyrosine phosphatase